MKLGHDQHLVDRCQGENVLYSSMVKPIRSEEFGCLLYIGPGIPLIRVRFNAVHV